MQLRVMRSRKAAVTSMFHLIFAIFIFILGLFFLYSLGSTVYGQVFGESSGFDTFVDDLDEAMEGETGDVSYTRLEMREGMAYIAMNPGENFVWDTSGYQGDFYPFFGERFERPSQCDDEKTCICSCDSSVIPESGGGYEKTLDQSICDDLTCKNVDFEIVEQTQLTDIFGNPVIRGNLVGPDSQVVGPGSRLPTDDVQTVDYSQTMWKNGFIINNIPVSSEKHVFSGFKEPSQIRDVYIVKEEENKMRLCFDADVCFDNT